MEALWQDYTFMLGKLGLARVRLVMGDAERVWESRGYSPRPEMLRETHELGAGRVMTLEFFGDEREMTPRMFEHLTELAAEAWLKSTNRWAEVNEQPVKFGAKV